MDENTLWILVKSAVEKQERGSNGAYLIDIGVESSNNRPTNRVWIKDDCLERISERAKTPQKRDAIPRRNFWLYAEKAISNGENGYSIKNKGLAPFGSFICSILNLLDEFEYTDEQFLNYIPQEGSNDPAITEAEIERKIVESHSLTQTEKLQIINARVGQGIFRDRQLKYWDHHCCLTECGFEPVLRASHIKPWRDSTNEERLDVFNGLLLAPNADALFDKGLISFDDGGRMLVSPQLPEKVLTWLGMNRNMTITLEEQHRKYLAFHRELYKANFQP